MGVKPSQVADLLALRGDAIDNIPGAPGIGDKGARDLIVRFGSVEAALDRAAEVQRKMYRESLLNNREHILLSKQLATIHTQCPSNGTSLRCGRRSRTSKSERPSTKISNSLVCWRHGPEDDSAHARLRNIADATALRTWLNARPAESAAGRNARSHERLYRPVVSGAAKAGRRRWRCQTVSSPCWNPRPFRRLCMT